MDVIKQKSGIALGRLITKLRIANGVINAIDPDRIKTNNSESVMVKTIEGEIIAYPGDWIVKINDDKLIVFKEATFKLLYSKI